MKILHFFLFFFLFLLLLLHFIFSFLFTTCFHSAAFLSSLLPPSSPPSIPTLLSHHHQVHHSLSRQSSTLLLVSPLSVPSSLFFLQMSISSTCLLAPPFFLASSMPVHSFFFIFFLYPFSPLSSSSLFSSFSSPAGLAPLPLRPPPPSCRHFMARQPPQPLLRLGQVSPAQHHMPPDIPQPDHTAAQCHWCHVPSSSRSSATAAWRCLTMPMCWS